MGPKALTLSLGVVALFGVSCGGESTVSGRRIQATHRMRWCTIPLVSLVPLLHAIGS